MKKRETLPEVPQEVFVEQNNWYEKETVIQTDPEKNV